MKCAIYSSSKQAFPLINLAPIDSVEAAGPDRARMLHIEVHELLMANSLAHSLVNPQPFIKLPVSCN